MIKYQCDNCGDEVLRLQQVAGVVIILPSPDPRARTLGDVLEGRRSGDPHEFQICVGCATGMLVALNARRLELRRTGRVVEQ
jgi:hypothetical protein